MLDWSKGGHWPKAQTISSSPVVEGIIPYGGLGSEENDSGKMKQAGFSTAASSLNSVTLSK